MKRLLALAACVAGVAMARPARAQDPTPAQLAAAREVISASHDSANFFSGFEIGMRRSLPATMDTAVVMPAVRQWSAQYLRWSELQPEYEKLYASFYTEAQLHELAAFLRSPLGRRMSEVTPQVAVRSMEIGQRAATAHMAELQELVLAALQKATPGAPNPE